MDPRRTQRTVTSPKVRQIGFFTPDPTQPDPLTTTTDTTTTATSPPPPPPPPPKITTVAATSSYSLPSVIIPPPRHHHQPSTATAQLSPLRPPLTASISELFPSTSPSAASISASSDDVASWSVSRTGAAPLSSSVPASELTTVSIVNLPPGVIGMTYVLYLES